MKAKMAIFCIFTSLNMFAVSNSFSENYFTNGGIKTNKIKELMIKDIYFIKGNEYLSNTKMMSKIKVNITDPELKNAPANNIIKNIPNWAKALEQFKMSVKLYNNPISAYQGMHIIKTTYGKSQQLQAYSKFSEVLYSQEKNICSAYIDYGETLEKGYFRSINKAEAYKIYAEGLLVKRCTSGWYYNVLATKKINLFKFK